ncbi:MAG: WhiB family transcriptional regulator, partial [Ilumatobacteraceae bacterium]
MTITSVAPAFRTAGACAAEDPELWFPPNRRSPNAITAKKACRACPVQGACLEYALDNDERYGIWGGLDEEER